LDKFVAELLIKDPEFLIKHPSEHALLKSFDRAFWMKFFKFPK
jgi:hypothetical protein